MKLRRAAFIVCLALSAAAAVPADTLVRNAAEFRAAVAAAQPGDRIVLQGGDYGGGYQFANLRGEPDRPIVIAAANVGTPPRFSGGSVGIHLAKPAYVELVGLEFTRHSANGLNIDDGGELTGMGAHHLVLRGLRVTDIGAAGNQDGIKISGVSDFHILDCTIERWGTRGGSAIDAVGCHRGLVEGNVFRHGDAPGCSGVQCKGGSTEIAIRANRFENAGGRAVNIGGSTGRQFFRPPLAGDGPQAESRAIRVEGNTFIGGMTPVAFAGADGGVVRFNTIERPSRWALRILQENRAADFVACRNGEFTDNVIIFESTGWSEGGVNIGPGTAAETFTFARNWWYCADRPERSAPRLPSPERDGVHGRAPAAAANVAGAAAWPAAAKRTSPPRS
ncbi:MAG: right-handed parallel beta-helix repeat-containing protein [Opitutaceae bacterium]|nr:right-handed parallel beta-helix repeat-containing protein [Opitutaceae bacterium]